MLEYVTVLFNNALNKFNFMAIWCQLKILSGTFMMVMQYQAKAKKAPATLPSSKNQFNIELLKKMGFIVIKHFITQ